jgi:hypothetical protein
MRPKATEARAFTGMECRGAWEKMRRGASLHKAASDLGVSPARLDRAIWSWRADIAGAKSAPVD